MSALENYLREPNDDDFKTVFKDVAANPKDVLGLVEKLGPSLTSIDKDSRANATRLLADILDQVEGLPSADLEHLAAFFCDRVKDHHSIVPHVLTAFAALSRNSALPDVCAVSIARAIFKHAEVQTLMQQHRAIALQVVVNLFNNKLEVMTMMGEEFSLGYIQMVDGEKDPRNLLTVFGLTQVLINSFPIGICCEDLFEVTACYFPVDFTPPPGDSFQITREQLADELRGAMSATRLFSAYCLPLLIEKISSDLQIAKQDSFRTLIACCKVYDVEDLRSSMNTLTQLLLREAMLSPSSRTEESALRATAAIAACLSVPVDGVTVYTDVDEYCRVLLKDCRHHLFEPGHKLVTPSIKILQSLVSSSRHAANTVLSDVLPAVLEQVNTSQEANEKTLYMGIVRQLFVCCCCDLPQNQTLALPTVMEHIKHENEDVKVAALQALAALSSISHSTRDICDRLLVIAGEGETAAVRKEASQCLAAFCEKSLLERSTYIVDSVCEKFTDITALQLSSLQLMDVITQRCAADVCNIVLPPLLHCCQLCLKDRVELFEPVLSSIGHALSSPPQQLDTAYLVQFLDMLTNAASLEFSEGCRTHMNQIIIQLVNSTEQSSLRDLVISRLHVPQLHPFAITSMQSFLCTVPDQVIDERLILVMFAPVCIDTSRPETARVSACKICCSVLNKSSQMENLTKELYDIYISTSISHLLLFVWTTKALVLRNHQQAQSFLLRMIDWLRVPELSAGAAEGFEVILRDYPDVLSPAQHPTRRMMYKQRVFVTAFPLLHDMFTSIQPELLANVHIAVTNLIRYVPRQVISNDRQMLLEVLVKLLSSDDEQVLLRTLQVMSDDADSSLLGHHVDTLLPVLLRLSRYPANMQVRMSSLQCLNSLSKLSTPLIVPHMNTVIRGLASILDDKKRLVRKEAVRASNTWCMLRDGY